MLNVKVTRDGEETEIVEVKARDISVWERAGVGRAFSNLRGGLRIADLEEMVHVALRRQGMDRGQTLEQFRATADVEPAKETVDPTQPAPQDEP